MADQELNDETYIGEQLLELQLLYEMDEIDGEKYALREAELRARLNAIREAEAQPESGSAQGQQGPEV